jgi:hypothetical protein
VSLLHENISKIYEDIDIANELLIRTPKAQEIRAKIDK